MPSDAIVTEDLTKVYGKLMAVDHVNAGMLVAGTAVASRYLKAE